MSASLVGSEMCIRDRRRTCSYLSPSRSGVGKARHSRSVPQPGLSWAIEDGRAALLLSEKKACNESQ
eukprot:14916773-Alexandrium_andersonii.AAC.1